MIITNATLVTLWEPQPLVEGALVAIEGKTIVDFGKMGKLIDRYEDTEMLDVGGRVLMPGLVNGHGLLWRSLAPGMPLEGVGTFRELQEKFWWRHARALRAEDIYMSSLVGLLDSVRGGFTSVIDQHRSPNAVEGSLDAIWRGFAEVGVRGCLSYCVSDADGSAVAAAGLEENRRFLNRCRAGRSDKMAGLLGLDASYAVTDDTISKAVLASQETDRGFHVNVAEDVSDLVDARAKYQKTPVERFALARVFEKSSVAVPCLHLEDKDYDLLKKTETTVVQCPQSNAASAAGLGDLGRLGKLGIPHGLGTDGFSNNLFEEFRASVLQQRMRGKSPSEAMELSFHAAFSGTADLATKIFGPPVGRIKPGARADLIVLDYTPSTPLTSVNLVEHLFAGLGRASVRTALINGKIVLRDGEFTALDEARIRARARQVATELWGRV
jgi:putative selenium metabolism protein SsnA